MSNKHELRTIRGLVDAVNAETIAKREAIPSLAPAHDARDAEQLAGEVAAGRESNSALKNLLEQSDLLSAYLYKTYGTFISEDFAVASNAAVEALAKFDAIAAQKGE